jgi:hypothetical protein
MAWTSSVAITIDHTKVPNTDQTNFPVLVTGTYPQLAAVASGGSVTSALGYDIIFASDSLGASPLTFQRANYASATGSCEFWVKIPSLSHTTDTVIYILFGNSAITTDQSSASSVWDANFAGVWHGTTDQSTVVADSTSNAISGSLSGSASVAANSSSKIAGAVTLSGGYADFGANAVLRPAAVTVEAWFKPSTASQTNFSTFCYQEYANPRSSPWGGYALHCNYSGTNTYQLKVGVSGSEVLLNSGVSIVSGSWAYVVGSFDGTTMKIYVNGSLSNSAVHSGSISYSNGVFHAGANGSGGESAQGSIDEIRVSGTARSADWIATCYNNQNSPSTFYSTSLTTASPAYPWPPFPAAPSSVQQTTSYFNPTPVGSILGSATVGSAYSEALTAKGGTSPYSFSITSGSLPTGLTLASGTISGTPSAAGTFTFTVGVTDANLFTGTQSFSIVVATAASSGGGNYGFVA